jgi:hypothetical protein
MPRLKGIVDGTPEWLTRRVGMVTASRVSDVMGFLKRGGESQARKDYKTEKLVEVMTGRACERYVTPAMQWGIDTQEQAVAAYEMACNVEPEPGGMWIHDNISRFSATPDCLIGEDGLLEAKCPTTSTHLEYIFAGVVPLDYRPQMWAQMACTGRKFCDFVSFDPRVPLQYRLFIRRLERDEEKITEVENAVIQFLEEIAGLAFGLEGAKMADRDIRAIPAHYVAPGSADDAGSAKEPSDGIGLSGRTLEDFR